MRHLRRFIFLSVFGAAASPAHAYRPFEGTDASVADAGEFELELGPFGRVREGAERSSLVPAMVANWGLGSDTELVLEGKRRLTNISPADGSARAGLVDVALSLKQVHRRGVLQSQPGAAVASECGLLLPGVYADHGAGATCAVIISQRWRELSIHTNAALTYDRQHKWAPFTSVIVEGASRYAVRPVAEVFIQRENSAPRTSSALIGLIWARADNLSFDVGFRRAHRDKLNINELRMGLTWAISQTN